MARKFSEEEKRNIIEDYKSGIRPYKLAEKYNRDSGTIIGMLKREKVFIPSKHHYTDDDIDFFREHYPNGEYEVIYERFPDITKQQIHSICSSHGIRYNDPFYWTKSDLDFIKRHYYDYSAKELSAMICNRHTEDAIQNKALKTFGYSKDRKWTENEIEILKQHYTFLDQKDLEELLPGRTWQAISKKASLIGIISKYRFDTYWNEHDLDFLHKNWKFYTDIELARILNRDRRSIQSKRWKEGLFRFQCYSKKSHEGLVMFLRGKITSWKNASMKACDYKCVLTGSKDFEIHHLYSFSHVFYEFLEKYNIVVKNPITNYSEEELNYIADTFMREHSKYPLGVCVRKDIHALFHQRYGNMCVPEMWEEFIENYKMKENAS